MEDLTLPRSTSSPFNRGFTEPYCSLWWYSVWTIKPHCYSSECIYTCTFNTCQSTFKVTCKWCHIAVMHISIYVTTCTIKTCKTIQYMGLRGYSAMYTGYLLILAITLTVLNTYMSSTSKDTIHTISQYITCVHKCTHEVTWNSFAVCCMPISRDKPQKHWRHFSETTCGVNNSSSMWGLSVLIVLCCKLLLWHRFTQYFLH